MNIYILIFIFFLRLPHLSFAQEYEFKSSEMVGFGCYSDGSPTKVVENIIRKLRKKKYRSVASLLKSDNSAKKYLAVISLERLNNMNKFVLTENDKELISGIKESQKVVSVCSGCVIFVKMPLAEAFKEKNREFAEYWLDEVIGD